MSQSGSGENQIQDANGRNEQTVQQFNFAGAQFNAESFSIGNEAINNFAPSQNQNASSSSQAVSSQRQAPSGINPSDPQTHTWERLKRYIDKRPFQADNAGNTIKCSGYSRMRGINLTWHCKCIDISTGISEKCVKYQSSYGACEHAIAELMRRMIREGKYPTPSDVNTMKTGCHK